MAEPYQSLIWSANVASSTFGSCLQLTAACMVIKFRYSSSTFIPPLFCAHIDCRISKNPIRSLSLSTDAILLSVRQYIRMLFSTLPIVVKIILHNVVHNDEINDSSLISGFLDPYFSVSICSFKIGLWQTSFLSPVSSPSASTTSMRLEWTNGSGFGCTKSDFTFATRSRMAESSPYALSSAAASASFFRNTRNCPVKSPLLQAITAPFMGLMPDAIPSILDLTTDGCFFFELGGLAVWFFCCCCLTFPKLEKGRGFENKWGTLKYIPHPQLKYFQRARSGILKQPRILTKIILKQTQHIFLLQYCISSCSISICIIPYNYCTGIKPSIDSRSQ